jgi:uncharacterized membrane protein YqiK
MNRPNPSHSRAVVFGAAALILASVFGAAAALAQSGRKAQKPLGLPTEKAKPADPADKPAEAKKQEALGLQRIAELEATQIAQARADAEKVRIEAEAAAQAEAIRITTVAAATAESIRKVNEAIQQGGEAYFRYKQIEMLPEIAPSIADALS